MLLCPRFRQILVATVAKWCCFPPRRPVHPSVDLAAVSSQLTRVPHASSLASRHLWIEMRGENRRMGLEIDSRGEKEVGIGDY